MVFCAVVIMLSLFMHTHVRSVCLCTCMYVLEDMRVQLYSTFIHVHVCSLRACVYVMYTINV